MTLQTSGWIHEINCLLLGTILRIPLNLGELHEFGSQSHEPDLNHMNQFRSENSY